jgi:hypothetical protein
VKTGGLVPIEDEVRHIRRLPSIIMPRILGTWSGGYAMEQLERIDVPPAWILDSVHHILADTVWVQSLPPMAVPDATGWHLTLSDRLQIDVPLWVRQEEFCLCHGDPTLANVMRRDGNLVLIDPKPPGRGIPPMASVDRGKMLQSLMGWECALLDKPIPSLSWPLGGLSDLELRRAIFWCRVHMLRIVQREGISSVGTWAADAAHKLELLIL